MPAPRGVPQIEVSFDIDADDPAKGPLGDQTAHQPALAAAEVEDRETRRDQEPRVAQILVVKVAVARDPLVALARVTASEYGYKSAGYEQAKELLRL